MKRLTLTLGFVVFGSFFSNVLLTQPTYASDLGNLISDSTFANENAMNEAQINNFINSFPNSCLKPSNYPSGLGWVTFREPLSYSTYGNDVSPARIIWRAATLYHINPQVILATLEKEQNLVTGSAGCGVWKYNSAMGYNCPDGSENALKDYPSIGVMRTCVAREMNAGFSRQVNHAGWQLIFDMHRSYGNTAWGGDGSVYYYGRMTEGWRSRVAGGAASYYDGYTIIDGQAIYLSNGATASLYNYTPHINSFKRIFTQWFGASESPAAFKADNSQTIYVPVGQNKLAVPHMAVLQDYGISPESIKTVSQSYIDSIASPATGSGISQSISHVVKTPRDDDEDGGSIYIISAGKRYQVQSMDQFNQFGFKESEISYLPLQYILNKPSGGMLSNFVTSPQGVVFKISENSKRIIFEYQTYITQNPSDSSSLFSYFLVDRITSGTPIVDRPVLIKPSNAEYVTLFTGTDYYEIPDYTTFQCWGFGTSLDVPVYRLASNSYTSPITTASKLQCHNQYSQQNFALLSGKKTPIATYMTPALINPVPASLQTLYGKIPTNNRPLSPYLITPGSAAVWYVGSGNGVRRVIPTYNTFLSIGLSAVNLDTIPLSLLESYTNNGIYLNNGQLVKDSGSAAVYIVDQNGRYSFPTSDLFTSFRNSWNRIDTINNSELQANYPIKENVSPVFVNKTTNQLYMAATNGCFNITQRAADFNISIDALKTTQSYDASIFTSLPALSTCAEGTTFIRSVGSSLVYQVENGQKRPIPSYSKFIALGNGTEPRVMIVDSLYISSMPTGTSH